MADNVRLGTPDPTAELAASEDIGGVQYQLVKLALGVPGANDGPVSNANPVPTKAGALTRTVLLNAVTATGASASYADNGNSPSFHYSLSGTGTVGATILLQVRNVASGEWELAGTTTLSGTTTAAGAAVIVTGSRFMEYRVNCTAISGTGATLTAAAAS
jgi:hypothetical protein